MIYLELFYVFFLIGLFTFGGGYAMIPLLKEKVVLEKGWIEEYTFLDLLGVAESTPGPVAINMATFVGSRQAGLLGSLIATLGVVLPSFIIILLLASILKKFIKNPYVVGFLNGVKPVVVALILSTGIVLAYSVFKKEGFFDYRIIIILVLLSLVLYFARIALKRKIHPFFIIVLSAILGILLYL